MSDMYAIKGSTLTAIGDAIRSKTIGQSELPYIKETVEISKSSLDLVGVNYFPYRFSGATKIKLIINHPNYAEKTQTWIRYYAGYSTSQMSSEYWIELPKDTVFPYETIIEGSEITIRTVRYSGSVSEDSTFTYEVIGLDKNGNEFKYTPLEMAETINGLMVIPEETLTITGNCSNRFANNGWDWFINQCGDKITTNNITDATSMFYKTGLKTIPFDINIASNTSSLSNIFTYADKLEVVPYIIGPEKKPPTSSYSGTLNMGYLFNNCQRVRYIPNDYFWKIVPNKDFWETQANIGSAGQDHLFGYCHSLRELPDISMIGGNWTSSYSCVYYDLLQFCYSLDEATNIPVYGAFTSNAMGSLFYNNYRLKEFMFLMNEDGTPKTANWKNQTIDLSTRDIGYGSYSPTSYNTGITTDKEVKDDATYQALKNDPDWYSRNINYSRYNHDSAVNTINSLPDCSATGTNTIKFKGDAGALTDGGAINTLTEEEIAVATAKGWTVSLV